MDVPSTSIPQNIKGPCAAIHQPATPAKMSVKEPSHCMAQDMEATFGISPHRLQDIPLVKTPPSIQQNMTAVLASSPPSSREEIMASVTSPLNQHIVTSPKPISPSQQIMTSAIKTDIFSQQSSLSTEHALTPVRGSSSNEQVSIWQESQSNQKVVAATQITSLNNVLKQTSPNRHIMIPVEQSSPREQFTTPAKVITPSQDATFMDENTFSDNQHYLLSAKVTIPSREDTFVDENTFSDNQPRLLSVKVTTPSHEAAFMDENTFSDNQQHLLSVKVTTPSHEATFMDKNTFSDNQQHPLKAKMSTPSQEATFLDENTFSDNQQRLLSAKVSTPSHEAAFLDKNTFSDNQHLLGERLSPADEHAVIVTKGTSPSSQAMTPVKGTSEDKMTFLTNQCMKGHLTSPCSFLSTSPILQESSSSSAFNIFGSFQEDLSTPIRLEHQHPTIQNDTLEESECLNLCSSEPMEQEVASTSAGFNDQRLMNAEDQTLQQLINALGDGDRQSFGKSQEDIMTTSDIAGKSADHSLDNSRVNPQNVCPTDQFELLSFQDELNSPLMNFCPGTPDTLTDPELSKNELSDAETLDASSSEKDGITAKSRRRKVYSKKKHDSRQPQVDVASGADLAKNGQSEMDVRSDVYERPTAQQIELALGVTSGQAEGQLVSTESGSQFMVVGGQVLEILGSGGNTGQTNIEEQRNEMNKWVSVDREELDTLVTALDHKKDGYEGHHIETKSAVNSSNDLEPREDLNGKDKGDERPKNFIRLVHDMQELRPTEGLMNRKERDERIKNLRASREEAQLGKSTNTLNNIESSSSGCIVKVKTKSSTCKTPPDNQNKCWIGTKGNYIPKTPSPIKEVIHSAPYGIGRTQIDGQDKLVILKSRQPTKDTGKFIPTKDGGRFDYDLRPTEGLMARKKDRGTINDYEQNTTNKTSHCGISKTAVKSDYDHDDEGMESKRNKKLESKNSMYMDTQNDMDNISNNSNDSTGMANSFEQTEAHRISYKTSVAQIGEIKLANTDTRHYCSSKAVDQSPHEIGAACENMSHEPFDSDETGKELSKEEAISANVTSQGHWNHLNNGNTRASSSHGMQSYSNNNDPLRTEMQQSHKMNHHNNITTNSRSCQPETHTNWSPINGRNICEDSGGHKTSRFNSNLDRGVGLVTTTLTNDLDQMAAGVNQCMETGKQVDSNIHLTSKSTECTKADPTTLNGSGNMGSYRNEGSNISEHPSSQNYQPFMGHMGHSTMNHNATVNCPSVPQQIPTYNGYTSKPIPDRYGQGASYPHHQPSQGASYPQHQPSQGTSYRNMYSYPQHQPSYFPQSYAQYYPQMYHQYLRYQSQLRYQMQLKQWYNSYYQRGAQWYNSFYQRNGQSYHNYYSNHYYPHGLMQNSHSGFSSFQGSHQNPMYQASNLLMNQQAHLGNPINEVRSNNPAHSQVFQGESAEIRGDDISQNLFIPFTSQVDNESIVKETNEGKEGQINYPEKEDNTKDLVAHQETRDSEVCQETSTPYNNQEPNEDVSSDIPNVQDQTNEMANIQFIKGDNKHLQNISTHSIGLEIDSRKRTSSNLQEDFPAFTYDHSSDSSIGESSSKKRCLQINEMEFPFTLNSDVEGVQTESSVDRVSTAAPEVILPVSPKETDASVINEVGSLNKNDASVVNEDTHFNNDADASVVTEVKLFSRNDVNIVTEVSSSTVAIFGEAPLLPRSEVGSVIESATNNKNEEEAECFDLNGDTMTNSPPGNLNNFALRRRPRSTYSKKMFDLLMREYVRSPYLTAGARSRLAEQLAISEDRILIWFKNQRSKDRTLKKKVPTEGGSDKEVVGAEKRDIVNEGVDQLAKLDSNNANMVIHLKSDHGNQVFSINCNPGNDLENNVENKEPQDDYDDNSILIGNNGINDNELNRNKIDEESKLDSNMNWMFLGSDSSTFDNTDQMDQQADIISNDTDNKYSPKIGDQLGMNENCCTYFEYNGDQVEDMNGDYGAKTNLNENADTDLSHEQLEKLFNNIDGEGPSDDQCIGDYQFDFNFEV